MAANAEIIFPLGRELYFTRTIFKNKEYFHIRKFVDIDGKVRPTKNGIVMNYQQLTCLKNILKQFDTSTTTAAAATPTAAATSSGMNNDFPAATTSPGLNDFPDFDDMFLLEHLIDTEKREKLERRFFE